MAKITKQVIKTFFSTNQPLSKLLDSTRSTIEQVRAFVEKEFQGDYRAKLLSKIDEYENTMSESGNARLTAEEEYLKVERSLEEKNARIESIPAEIEALLNQVDLLKSEKLELEEEVLDLKEKLDKLQKEMIIHLVFPNSFYSSISSKHNLTFKPIEELVEEIGDNEIGDILSKIYEEIPKQMQFSDVINLVKSILLIKQKVKEGRKIQVYVPQELVEIFVKNTNLEEEAIFTDVL